MGWKGTIYGPYKTKSNTNNEWFILMARLFDIGPFMYEYSSWYLRDQLSHIDALEASLIQHGKDLSLFIRSMRIGHTS